MLSHFNFTAILAAPYGEQLLKGLQLTAWLTISSWTLAFVLGTVLATVRVSGNPIAERFVAGYVAYHQNVPMLVHILLWYFGIPTLLPEAAQNWANANGGEMIFASIAIGLCMAAYFYFLVPLLLGHSVTGFTTLLCTLVIYEAAYISEVIRAGIEALPRGQTEAARALGLSHAQTMTKVILPQALYNMIPSIVSQFVSTIKETSLGYVISVQELTFSANQVNTNLLTRPFEVFLILALTYFAVCFCLTQLAHAMERRVTRRRSGKTSGKTAPARSIQNDSVLQSQ
ncbi:amino acid ABC transporter permease [Cupriavidus necator]